MVAEKTKVYLDHLIRRESLRYKRSEEQMDHNISHEPQVLRLKEEEDKRVKQKS